MRADVSAPGSTPPRPAPRPEPDGPEDSRLFSGDAEADERAAAFSGPEDQISSATSGMRQ